MCPTYVEVRLTLYAIRSIVQVTVCFDQYPMKHCVVVGLIHDDGTLIALDDRNPVTIVVDAATNLHRRVFSDDDGFSW